LKKNNLKEERVVLLESWKEFETEKGDEEHLKKVEQMMPKIVKKRRRIEDETGGDQVTWEEYLDYIFPDEEKEKPVFKLLSMAHAWKQKMEEAKSNDQKENDDDDDKKKSDHDSDDNDDDDDDDSDDE